MVKVLALIIASLVFSTSASASGGYDHPRRGHGYYPKHRYDHPHRHKFKRYRPVERVYYREEIHYYPERVVVYEPIPRYRPVVPPHYYDRYDRRTSQGLIGGAMGGALGYEIGRGDPIASGIGAAAGSLLGNEWGRR